MQQPLFVAIAKDRNVLIVLDVFVLQDQGLIVGIRPIQAQAFGFRVLLAQDINQAGRIQAFA